MKFVKVEQTFKFRSSEMICYNYTKTFGWKETKKTILEKIEKDLENMRGQNGNTIRYAKRKYFSEGEGVFIWAESNIIRSLFDLCSTFISLHFGKITIKRKITPSIPQIIWKKNNIENYIQPDIIKKIEEIWSEYLKKGFIRNGKIVTRYGNPIIKKGSPSWLTARNLWNIFF